MVALLVLALALMGTLFAVVWAICVRVGNYGYLDAMWSLSVAILAPLYAWLGNGDVHRRIAFAIVGTLWSLRLGLYIFIRVTRHHPKEDARYATLRERWPGPGRFLVFFELQALIAVLFSVPFLLAAMNTHVGLSFIEWGGIGTGFVCDLRRSIGGLASTKIQARSEKQIRHRECGLMALFPAPKLFFRIAGLVGLFYRSAGLALGLGYSRLSAPDAIPTLERDRHSAHREALARKPRRGVSSLSANYQPLHPLVSEGLKKKPRRCGASVKRMSMA